MSGNVRNWAKCQETVRKSHVFRKMSGLSGNCEFFSKYQNSLFVFYEFEGKKVPPHRLPRQKLGAIDSRFLPICVDFCRNASTYVEKCRFLPIMSCCGDMSRFWSTYVEICRKMSISERFLSIYVDLCRFLSLYVDLSCRFMSIYVEFCQCLSR